MIGALLVVAVSQLDAFDAANLALTQCAYTTLREAAANDLTVAQFEGSITGSCADEIAALRREIVAIERSRGETASRATDFADRQIARFRADFRQQYARRAEDEANLGALERALREENR